MYLGIMFALFCSEAVWWRRRASRGGTVAESQQSSGQRQEEVRPTELLVAHSGSSLNVVRFSCTASY